MCKYPLHAPPKFKGDCSSDCNNIDATSGNPNGKENGHSTQKVQNTTGEEGKNKGYNRSLSKTKVQHDKENNTCTYATGNNTKNTVLFQFFLNHNRLYLKTTMVRKIHTDHSQILATINSFQRISSIHYLWDVLSASPENFILHKMIRHEDKLSPTVDLKHFCALVVHSITGETILK